MVKATFEYEGNSGLLTITTHFGATYSVACEKADEETFRLGGTAVHQIASHEAVIVDPRDYYDVVFRAFHNTETYFEANGILAEDTWDDSDFHCFVTEFYDLYMEGKKPSWIVTKKPIKDANYLFVNLDVLDGGGNVIKRYRASPFLEEYRVMDAVNG